MFNNDTFNSQVYNYSFEIATIETDSIQFEAFSLQNTEVITSKINYDDLEQVEINQFRFTGRDGGGVLSRYYIGRRITLTGTIVQPTATTLNAKLDAMKKGLSKKEGLLYITVNSERRQIKATCQSVVFDREHYNVSFSRFSIVFVTAEPFFYADELDRGDILGVTGDIADEFTANGTAETLPRLLLAFASWTTATQVEIVDDFSNTLTITTALTTNDILIIDSDLKTVTKNGTEIDYSGVFPIFTPWQNQYTVDFTWSVVCDMNIQAKRNYL